MPHPGPKFNYPPHNNGGLPSKVFTRPLDRDPLSQLLAELKSFISRLINPLGNPPNIRFYPKTVPFAAGPAGAQVLTGPWYLSPWDFDSNQLVTTKPLIQTAPTVLTQLGAGQVPAGSRFQLVLRFNKPVPASLGPVMVQAFSQVGLRSEDAQINGNEARITFNTGNIVRGGQDIANALIAVIVILAKAAIALGLALALGGFGQAGGFGALYGIGEGAGKLAQDIEQLVNARIPVNPAEPESAESIPIGVIILGGIAALVLLRN